MRSAWCSVFGKLTSHVRFSHEYEQDRDYVKNVTSLPSYCADALDYVVRRKMPELIAVMKQRGHRTFYQAGHEVIMAMLPALLHVLKDDVKLVRLHRSRLDVAYSFYASKQVGPCSSACSYCICPLDGNARCPVSGKVWATLSVFEQYLWMVDEVECLWQSVARQYPHVPTMTMEWSQAIRPQDMRRLGDFLGAELGDETKQEKAKPENVHVEDHVRSAKNLTQLAEWDAHYRKALGLQHCTEYTCIPAL